MIANRSLAGFACCLAWVALSTHSTNAGSDQLPKAPTVPVTIPVDLHNLPHGVTNGGINCAIWRSSVELLAWGSTTFPGIAGGGDYHREFTIVMVMDAAAHGSLDASHFVCALGFTGTVDGHSFDFLHYHGGGRLETTPWTRPAYEITTRAGSPLCTTIGGPVLPLPIGRRLTCFDTATDGTCPCGCGNTGRCTSGTPGFLGLGGPPQPPPATTASPRQGPPVVARPAPPGVYQPPPGARGVTGMALTSTGAFGPSPRL